MVLTEEALKLFFAKNKEAKEFQIEEGAILTPSAKQYLNEKGIKLTNKLSKESCENNVEPITPTYKYRGENGEYFLEKPESMTQLFGNILVSKSHKRIYLRGKIDSLQSKWLVLTKEFENLKNNTLQKDLKNIENFIKKILISEVMDLPFEETTILGETFDNIRSFSHNPKKYFGCAHLFDISSNFNLLTLRLNELRSFSREVELASINCGKEDLILAFNRLSSAIYIMMLKEVSGKYGTR